MKFIVSSNGIRIEYPAEWGPRVRATWARRIVGMVASLPGMGRVSIEEE